MRVVRDNRCANRPCDGGNPNVVLGDHGSDATKFCGNLAISQIDLWRRFDNTRQTVQNKFALCAYLLLFLAPINVANAVFPFCDHNETG